MLYSHYHKAFLNIKRTWKEDILKILNKKSSDVLDWKMHIGIEMQYSACELNVPLWDHFEQRRGNRFEMSVAIFNQHLRVFESSGAIAFELCNFLKMSGAIAPLAHL